MINQRRRNQENVLIKVSIYSLSRKTVNTNQMQDETAKDNHQTAALISYDLMWNNELAFSSTWHQFFFLDFGLGIPKE